MNGGGTRDPVPQFSRKGDLLTVAYITGPRHLWLGLKLTRSAVAAPIVLKQPPIGTCSHGMIDEGELVAAVVAACGEQGFCVERIEYVENDSPVYSLYAHCARLLVERVLKGEA